MIQAIHKPATYPLGNQYEAFVKGKPEIPIRQTFSWLRWSGPIQFVAVSLLVQSFQFAQWQAFAIHQVSR